MDPKNWIETLKLLRKKFDNKGFWTNLEYSKPVSIKKINEIEKENNVKFPTDFKEILQTVAGSCVFEWSSEDNEMPEEFNEITSGGAEFLWDFEQVENISDFVIAEYGFNPEHIFAFMWTGGGDIIAFDTSKGVDNSPVIYINHDGGEVGEFPEDDKECLHGYRLGMNFIDFMNRWISLGCPGNEYDSLIPFYDFEKNMLRDPNDLIVEKWVNFISR